MSLLLGAALASCGDSASVVPTNPKTDGWKTIEYHGVRVDIPVDWNRADTSDCDFHLERWTPPEVPACSVDGGVFFYRSATFDPAHGPGIRHDNDADDAVAWEGYVDAGDYDVYAADGDRATVRHLLSSVRAPGGPDRAGAAGAG